MLNKQSVEYKLDDAISVNWWKVTVGGDYSTELLISWGN